MGEDSLGVQVLGEGLGLANWPRALPGTTAPLGLGMWARVCRSAAPLPTTLRPRRPDEEQTPQRKLPGLPLEVFRWEANEVRVMRMGLTERWGRRQPSPRADRLPFGTARLGFAHAPWVAL